MVDRKQEILSQYFINAKELKELVPSLGIGKCREIIKYARQKEIDAGAYPFLTKPIIAPTDRVLEILKLRR